MERKKGDIIGMEWDISPTINDSDVGCVWTYVNMDENKVYYNLPSQWPFWLEKWWSTNGFGDTYDNIYTYYIFRQTQTGLLQKRRGKKKQSSVEHPVMSPATLNRRTLSGQSSQSAAKTHPNTSQSPKVPPTKNRHLQVVLASDKKCQNEKLIHHSETKKTVHKKNQEVSEAFQKIGAHSMYIRKTPRPWHLLAPRPHHDLSRGSKMIQGAFAGQRLCQDVETHW